MFKKSAQSARMEARRARIEYLRQRQAGSDEAPLDEDAKAGDVAAAEEPEAGSQTPVTILNSAWTWSMLSYLFVLGIGAPMMLQAGLDIFAPEIRMQMLAAVFVLIYPAWRIGALLSRFLKARGFGASFSMPGLQRTGAGRPPAPGSVEERMAARQARVEKARKAGKL